VRERGTQSRRLRSGPPDRGRHPAPPEGSEVPGAARPSRSDGPRFWQVLAIVAIIAATAGWTTAATLALRPPAESAVATDTGAVPTDDLAALPSDDTSIPPLDLTHDVPGLEPLLPVKAKDTPLVTMSWTGDAIFGDDGWSTTLTKFLAGKGKTPADLQVAQSMDSQQSLDLVVRLFRADGIAPSDLLASMIQGWKVDYPDMTITDTTLGGKAVQKGDFGSEGVDSYWYIEGDHVFDIETSDESIAASALEAIPAPGSVVVPSGSGGGASKAPSAAPSAVPSPS
jgi:hypothetical protein